jgi:hypothetical protein
MNKVFNIFTDTATIAVFDLQAIRHRVSDAPDWWSIVKDELLEMNEGNIAFFGLGQDGSYTIKVVETIEGEADSLNLYFPSGRVFVGAGEDTSGGGLEPDGSESIQGAILNFVPGMYNVKYRRVSNVLELSFKSGSEKNNLIISQVKI